MTKLTKSDLIKRVAETASINQATAKDAINGLIEVLSDLAPGDEVSLTGFGKFSAKLTPEHIGRNPATGEAITIPAKRKLTFKPAKTA